MFDGIRSKLNDMSTIKRLCERAEVHALQDQEREPGAEHFLLAALDLPDGTARLAFEQAGVAPEALKAAIERQYGDALQSIGLTADALPDMSVSANPGAYKAAPSGQAIMQELAATRRDHAPLLSAHVVSIVADMPQGVASRALRALGVDPAILKSSADAIVEKSRGRGASAP